MLFFFFLIFSRNHLTVIPVSICQLPLEVLLIANNRLTGLPEELGHCKTLMELDISCNQITHLPPQLGHLSSLRILNVRNNLLLELPIGKFILFLYFLKIILFYLLESQIRLNLFLLFKLVRNFWNLIKIFCLLSCRLLTFELFTTVQ